MPSIRDIQAARCPMCGSQHKRPLVLEGQTEESPMAECQNCLFQFLPGKDQRGS